MSLRLAAASVTLGAWLLCAATPAGAQARGEPDAADLALSWARGGFASPVVCRFPEGAQRGLRRVLIEPGPRTSEQRVDRVSFVDLSAKGSERCTDDLGADEPNVIGTIYITHVPRRPHSDTAERDFKQDVERGPIAFAVVRGRLRVGPASSAVESLPDIDFAGARFELATIRPGSDDARRVADLPSARALRLEIEAKDGTRIAFPLVEVERR